MLNNLVVFCQNNHLNILGVVCLGIFAFAVVIALATVLNRKIKLLSTGLVFVASTIMFLTKAFMWIWLVMELVVLLNMILVF